MNFFSGQITPEPLPEFLAPLENHTVIQGRDIFFTCVVNNLHSYKVVCACFFDEREKKNDDRKFDRNPKLFNAFHL